MEERRRNKRIELQSKIVMKALNGDNPDTEIIIDVTDVSKTGAGFTCNEILTIGTVYEAYLTIWTQEVLHTFIEVVRIGKKEDTFQYGASFVGMPGMEAFRIGVYDTVKQELAKQNK